MVGGDQVLIDHPEEAALGAVLPLHAAITACEELCLHHVSQL